MPTVNFGLLEHTKKKKNQYARSRDFKPMHKSQHEISESGISSLSLSASSEKI